MGWRRLVGRKVVGWTTAAVIAGSTGIIAAWEGLRHDAYLDIVGVATICYGSTKDVRLGMRKTTAECLALLEQDIAEHFYGMKQCLRVDPPFHTTVSLLSLAFNVGVPRFCASTLVRQINEGLPPEVYCQQFDRWVFAGGKRVRGLENRRRDEKALCLGTGRWMTQMRQIYQDPNN